MNKIIQLCYLIKKAWETSKGYFLVTVVKSVFLALIPLVNIAGLGLVIDALVSGETMNNVIRKVIVYLSVNLIISLASQVLTLLDNNMMRKASNKLQYEYIQTCIDVDYHYAQDGNLLSLKRKSMLAQPAFFLSLWGTCINYIAQFIGVIFIFSLLSPIFIAIIIVISSLLIGMTIFVQKWDYKFNSEKIDDDRKLDYLYDVMTSYKYAKEIRINNANKYIKNKYHLIFQNQAQKLKCLLHKKFGANLLYTVLSIAQTAIIYLYFTYQVFMKYIDIAQYTVLLASTTLFTSIFLSFFSNLNTINNCLKSVEFYNIYEQTIKNNSVVSNSNGLTELNLDFSNAIIKFENVSFVYPNTNGYVLQNVNMEIVPKKKLGIVGLNGSGKTTIIKLLLRLYHPTDGRITLNGIDICKIPYRQYVENIGVILQDFSLFAYSLKENIIFDKKYNSDLLFKSIKKSGLNKKVQNLPYGIDTSIYRDLDDKGVEFSGGEGQRLAMARAIYKSADILILDEPTSALDPMAEYEFFLHLNEISEGKTTVFISHRLYSTHFCDNIIVLKNGKIIEQGTHNELMEQNGYYAKLYISQGKFYKEKGKDIK